MTGAYYNEIDPKAAAWLRELIKAGVIAPGEVDDRSILDVTPAELAGFTQCHFFAGIGVWSYALRLARWPDDRPVWTGSCPCQPFSAAGKGEGFDDERHLWPHWFHLIEQCRPAVLVGEQVASKNADPWIDLVQDDLEALGYAFGAVPFPAAGVGAPHIRDRTYWLANADGARSFPSPLAGVHRGEEGAGAWHGELERPSSVGRLADASISRKRALDREPGSSIRQQESIRGHGVSGDGRSGPTNGLWRDADWLLCRDGKWRPVEASAQPLVDGSAPSLGRVRPSIIAAIEEEIGARSMEAEGGRAEGMRALLETLGTEAQYCWPAGGLPGLHEAPFLLAFLRQLQEQGWALAQGVSLPRAETTSGVLRSVWNAQAVAGASHRRELAEQRAGESTDAVHFLSSLLARHAQQAWGEAHAAYAEVGFPLGTGSRARVGRLRGYGNAIVAEAAAEFIRASQGVGA